jgi:NAD+ kinase
MLILTPLSPHSLNNRSIILSAVDVVTIEIDNDKYGNGQQAEVIFDGNRRVAMESGERIMIRRAERTTNIIKLNGTNFLEILKRKMSTT